MVQNKQQLPEMNLCFFSEETAPTQTQVEPKPDVSADGGADTSEKTAAKEKTYTQQEFDKLLKSESAKAIKAFKEKELPELLKGAQSEAEKLAKMTESQRAEHDRKRTENDLTERLAKLEEREKEVAKKELRTQVIKTLTEKGLSAELAEIVDYADADSCGSSIELIERVIRKGIEDGVNARLKPQQPPKAANNPKADSFLSAFGK